MGYAVVEAKVGFEIWWAYFVGWVGLLGSKDGTREDGTCGDDNGTEL